MSKRNEVVLLESDDEEQQRPLKIHKNKSGITHPLEEDLQTQLSPSKLPDMKKAFMDSDAESNDEVEYNGAKAPIVSQDLASSLLDSSSNEVAQSQESTLESPFDSDSDSDSDGKSSLEPISVEEYKASLSEAQELNSEGENEPVQDPTQIPSEVRVETRKYLKTHGMMKFLDKYLPTTASADDILGLILKLGFLPKDISDYDNEDNLIRLIQILNMAMKKTISMRNRLPNFKNLDHLIDKLQNANKIMVITGAGISTSLGIPDFRSSKGFYSQLENIGLSDPQEVFDLDFFHTDPSIFYSIAHMILPPSHKYTPLHAFIKVLQDKGKLLRNYTQNIDNLEGSVGIDPEKLVQCHGSFAFASCVTCKYQVPGEKIFKEIRNKEIPYCPKCTSKRKKLLKKEGVYVAESYGVMKPDITFFGEPLPNRFHKFIKQDIYDCDFLICIGTSLKVAPVSHILDRVPDDIPQVLLNKDPIEHFNLDISLLGYCDDAASYLCDKLGWELPYLEENGVELQSPSNLKLKDIDSENGVYSLDREIVQ